MARMCPSSRPALTERALLFVILVLVVTLAASAITLETVFPTRDNFAEVRRLSGWRLKEVVFAIRNYAEAHQGRLPPAVVIDKAGRPLYSWRVAILPFFDEDSYTALHKEFHLDEPWDSDHNKRLVLRMPSVYRSPLPSPEEAAGLTFYQVLVGPGTAFERPGLPWKDFPDGASWTFLVVEAAERVPWSAPVDLVYDPDGPLPKFGRWFSAPSRFWGRHIIQREAGFNAGLAEGTYKFLRESTDETVLRAWIVRNHGPKPEL
jgi:hypothetical protein